MKKNRVKAISAIAPILTPRVVYTICDPYRMVALLGYTIISVFKRCLIWRGASRMIWGCCSLARHRASYARMLRALASAYPAWEYFIEKNKVTAISSIQLILVPGIHLGVCDRARILRLPNDTIISA